VYYSAWAVVIVRAAESSGFIRAETFA